MEVHEVPMAVGQAPGVQVEVQDVPTAFGKAPEIQVEVHSGSVQLVPPIQPRRGLRSRITLGEEIL